MGHVDLADGRPACHPEAFAQGPDESEEPEPQMPETDIADDPAADLPIPFVLDPHLARISHLTSELQKLRDLARRADNALATFQNTQPSISTLQHSLITVARTALTKAQETL